MLSNPGLQFRKMMGTTYLNEDRIAEAAGVFAAVLRDYPEDVDSLLVMGNFYLSAGDGNTAGLLYNRAHQLDPQNLAITRQVWLAESLSGSGQPEPVPTDPSAIQRILQQLTGKKQEINETDISQAASLLEQIVNSENPAAVVAGALDQIDDLLPALIELNIRQAIADGKHELAEGLHSLQNNILLQMRAAAFEKEPQASGPLLAAHRAAGDFTGRVLILSPADPGETDRLNLAAEALRAAGCQVDEANKYSPSVPKPDVVVLRNAHLSPQLLESAAALSASSIPMILDLDQDFERLPVTHPDYNTMGLSTPIRARAYSTALLLADRITVNSDALADLLSGQGYPAVVIPDGWSSDNPLWSKPARQRPEINIGWIHLSGQVEDLATIRRVLIRILREFINTQIVVIGDSEAYRLFEPFSERRRTFLPAVSPDEIPYLLSQVDILVAPARNMPFQRTFSDRPLVLAGARGIPWVATPLPAYSQWQAGGFLANDQNEWYLALRHLVMDLDLRKATGQAGALAARQRVVKSLIPHWQKVISETFEAKAAGQKALQQP